MANAKPRDQPGQRNLRRIRRSAEHGFAEEGAAQLDAVEPADQPVLVPAFDRMGMSDRVKPERRPLDRAVDPGLLAVGAGQQHLVEGRIACHRESARTDAPGKRTRQMEAVQRDDCPASRLDPEDVAGVAAVGHREDAGGVTAQQHPGVQTLAHPLALTESDALPLADGKGARPCRFRPEDAGSGSDVPSSHQESRRR